MANLRVALQVFGIKHKPASNVWRDFIFDRCWAGIQTVKIRGALVRNVISRWCPTVVEESEEKTVLHSALREARARLAATLPMMMLLPS
jgi:hypothetical protein